MNIKLIIKKKKIETKNFYNKLLRNLNDKNLKIKIDKNNNNLVKIYNSEKKKILIGEYQLLGRFDTNNNIWSWGDTLIGLNNNITNKIKKIKDFSVNLDTNIKYNNNLNLLLNNSINIINNSEDLENLLFLSNYLLDGHIIMNYQESSDKNAIYFLVITKINEKYY